MYVIDTLGTGGAERHLTRLIRGLSETGQWDISVFCLSRTGPFVAEIEALGVPVLGPREDWQRSARGIVVPCSMLYRHVRRTRPEIVHCYLNSGGLFGSVIARLAGVPRVVTTRREVHTFTGLRLAVFRVGARVMDACSDRIISVSQEAVRQAVREGTPARKLVTIANSVTVSATAPTDRAPRRSPVFITVARLKPRKGLHYLLDAIPRVLSEYPSSRWLIAGDGPERLNLERRAMALGISDHVDFLGNRTDIPELLARADIFVLPSLVEGVPNALLEAMASGMPAIATRVGGVPEVLSHDVTGLVVDPASAAQLAAAMLTLATEPEIQSRLGRAAREAIEQRFQPSREIAQTEAVYIDLVRPLAERSLSRADPTV